MKFLARLAPYFLSALRIAAAITFVEHGTQKLIGLPVGSRVPLASLIGLAGILETAGGALMLLGVFTRPLALVLAGEMAYAYFTVHAPQGRWPIQNQGELAVLYCFVWLYVSAAGPGPISVDRALRKA
jgi:putative oxidoreductase